METDAIPLNDVYTMKGYMSKSSNGCELLFRYVQISTLILFSFHSCRILRDFLL